MTKSSKASVSTHILDTSVGRPAPGVAVRLSARGADGSGGWQSVGGSVTDEDGRCRDLPDPPQGTTHVRLEFAVEPYLAATAAAHPDGAAVFFPEVTVAFAVRPGEHHHVPLLLSPFGYSVYRGS
ncbi:hydroxyisourate hydrolase [Streptomyces sp. YIM S03343]